MRIYFKHLLFKNFFQWYKEVFNPMSFDLSNYSLKIWDSIGFPTLKMEVHLGVCGLIRSHTFSHSWECECDFWVALSAYTFPSPRFGCELKIKVATIFVFLF